MLLLRDYGTMKLADVLAPAICYAQRRPSAGRARQRDHRDGRGAVPRALADLGGGLSARRRGAGAGDAVHQHDAGRDLRAHPARGARAPAAIASAQIERARKVWSQGFVAEAIDRFCRTQEVMDTSGERHRGVLTGDDMARWQAARRSAAHLRLRPLHRVQGRPVEPGAGDAAAARAAQGLRSRRPRPDQRRISSISLVECSKLAYRRPRDVLRRSGFRRGADGDAAVRCLQRRAAQARHRQGLAGTAARDVEVGRRSAARRGRRCGPASRRRPRPGARRSAIRAPASRRVGRIGEVRGDTVHFDIVDQRRQHGVGDAVGRLAAILAGHSRARLLPRHARADVLARGGPSRPRSRPASGRAPRCRPRWRCATASPTSPGARPAATSRTNGSTQFFLRHVHAGMNLQEAIDAPAWHSEHFPISFWPRKARPGVLVVEGRLPAGDGEGAEPPRPHRRGRPRLVRGPPHRRVARRPPPPRRRQSARHAGLRGGAVGPDCPRPDLASSSSDPCCLEYEPESVVRPSCVEARPTRSRTRRRHRPSLRRSAPPRRGSVCVRCLAGRSPARAAR